VQRHTCRLSTRDGTHHRGATVGSAAADGGRRRGRRPTLPQCLRTCRLRRSRRSAAARASAGAHDCGMGGDAGDNVWGEASCSRCGAMGGVAAAAHLQSGGTHDAGLNLPRRMCELSSCSHVTKALLSACASQPASCGGRGGGRFGSQSRALGNTPAAPLRTTAACTRSHLAPPHTHAPRSHRGLTRPSD
jgi:hypothetical protein